MTMERKIAFGPKGIPAGNPFKIDRFKNWQKPDIVHGKPTKYGWTCYYPENLIMGQNVDIGYGSFLQAANGIELGDNVQLGGGVFVYSVDTILNHNGKVIIKKNARIGALTIIMPGITIGKNAIIGAHSFVNKDIPDNGKFWGIPARDRRKNK